VKPLAHLPNTEGFRFVGIRHDGSRVNCHRQYSSYAESFVTYGDGPEGYNLDSIELAGWEPVEAGSLGTMDEQFGTDAMARK
jgi:hypothetical protein